MDCQRRQVFCLAFEHINLSGVNSNGADGGGRGQLCVVPSYPHTPWQVAPPTINL